MRVLACVAGERLRTEEVGDWQGRALQLGGGAVPGSRGKKPIGAVLVSCFDVEMGGKVGGYIVAWTVGGKDDINAWMLVSVGRGDQGMNAYLCRNDGHLNE